MRKNTRILFICLIGYFILAILINPVEIYASESSTQLINVNSTVIMQRSPNVGWRYKKVYKKIYRRLFNYSTGKYINNWELVK